MQEKLFQFFFQGRFKRLHVKCGNVENFVLQVALFFIQIPKIHRGQKPESNVLVFKCNNGHNGSKWGQRNEDMSVYQKTCSFLWAVGSYPLGFNYVAATQAEVISLP